MEGVESEFELWPIEHPSEPRDEDRPLKCPISSHSPSFTNQKNKSNLERRWKRTEEQAGKGAGVLRKRHHELTQDEDEDEEGEKDNTNINPLIRMSPVLYPYQPHDVIMFDMFRHFNKFEST